MEYNINWINQYSLFFGLLFFGDDSLFVVN